MHVQQNIKYNPTIYAEDFQVASFFRFPNQNSACIYSLLAGEAANFGRWARTKDHVRDSSWPYIFSFTYFINFNPVNGSRF
jgi:hypothetical protein